MADFIEEIGHIDFCSPSWTNLELLMVFPTRPEPAIGNAKGPVLSNIALNVWLPNADGPGHCYPTSFFGDSSNNKTLDNPKRLVYLIIMRRIHSKETIIQAGLDLVLQRGFNGTGVEAILRHANIPKGSFYNYFSSKEEFAIAIIDKFVEQLDGIMQDVLEDTSFNPLERIKNCFEKYIEIVETNNCNGGCLIANLSLELADNSEPIRQRLEGAWQNWAKAFSRVILEAQKEKTISADLNSEMLAENMITSYEGALIRAKVKKSIEPLKSFMHLYFDKFLTHIEEKI